VSNFLTEVKGKKLLDRFLSDYKDILNDNVDFLAQSKEHIRTGERFDYLTEKWYEELRKGNIDAAYEVYSDEHYMTDQFNCFREYARNYLRAISKSTKLIPQPLTEFTNDATTIVDVGNGMGYSTVILSQLYPSKKIYGTNLRDTDQWKFGTEMSKRYGFNMVEDVTEIPETGGLVFASEYFEHHLDPIKHVDHIVEAIDPKYFVIANAFNTHSIGHFETYENYGVKVPQDKISKIFNNKLRELGYNQVKTGLFNNKPTLWKKVCEPKTNSLEAF